MNTSAETPLFPRGVRVRRATEIARLRSVVDELIHLGTCYDLREAFVEISWINAKRWCARNPPWRGGL